jgi:hypothetical protein
MDNNPQSVPPIQPGFTAQASPSSQANGRYPSNPFDLIRPSFEAFKLIWKILLLIIVAVLAGAFAFGGLIVLAVTSGAAAIGILIGIPVIFYATGYIGWAFTKATIAGARGQQISVRQALPSSFIEPLQFIATAFLVVVVVFGGLILLIVPGVIFLGWLSQTMNLVVDEGIWGISALKRSRLLTRGRVWESLGTYLLSSVASIAAVIPFIGIAVYCVVVLILMPVIAVRYVTLIELKSRPDWQFVPTHPLNYLVVILGLLLSSYSQSHTTYHRPIFNSNQTPLENSPKPY